MVFNTNQVNTDWFSVWMSVHVWACVCACVSRPEDNLECHSSEAIHLVAWEVLDHGTKAIYLLGLIYFVCTDVLLACNLVHHLSV